MTDTSNSRVPEPGTGRKDRDARLEAARRILGVPEREVKGCEETDQGLVVEVTGGNKRLVRDDGTVENVEVGGKPARPHRRVIANGADVPAVVTEASSTTENGSSDEPVDGDPDDLARRAELTGTEDDVDLPTDGERTPEDQTPAQRERLAASTKGTTEAAKARRG